VEQKAEVIQQLVWFKSGPPRLELTEEGPFLCLYLDGIMQSKMNQLAPAATLSAHLEPVLYSLQRLKPDAVLQLGLGGGDINRFMTTVLPNTHLLTIELSHEVIDAYQRFFVSKVKSNFWPYQHKIFCSRISSNGLLCFGIFTRSLRAGSRPCKTYCSKKVPSGSIYLSLSISQNLKLYSPTALFNAFQSKDILTCCTRLSL